MQFRDDPFADAASVRFKEGSKFISIANQFCEEFLSNKLLIDELRADQYDLGITEIYELCPCGLFELMG
ncbi:unnamed protein product, partial [Gongylonema pulchrum]|uniref:DUF3791 domain-containing protein n=1 Tax=Gongylonema pulchrum TaxID=637853 RepID=A0A183DHN6_9BILA